MNIGMGRQLEMFPKYLEDVGDYESKVAAFNYFLEYERSTEEQRIAKFKKIRDMMNPPYYYEEVVMKDVKKLNDFVKFPFASFERSTTPDNRGRYVYHVHYKTIDKIYDYARLVIARDGELLPSKYQQKRA